MCSVDRVKQEAWWGLEKCVKISGSNGGVPIGQRCSKHGVMVGFRLYHGDVPMGRCMNSSSDDSASKFLYQCCLLSAHISSLVAQNSLSIYLFHTE